MLLLLLLLFLLCLYLYVILFPRLLPDVSKVAMDATMCFLYVVEVCCIVAGNNIHTEIVALDTNLHSLYHYYYYYYYYY